MTRPATPIERAVEGRFGRYGGRYVPETLMAALEQLESVYTAAQADPTFWPTPLTEVPRLSGLVAPGVRVVLKREDLNHTGAHKINNTLGQALLARRMGKRRIIAETGAGQHGVATATVCARFGVVGPDPFPRIVRDFQAVIGREARAQMLERFGRLPRSVVACVGGGSNAMGIFTAFLNDPEVELVGVEAAGEGIETERHAASLARGRPGVFHGSLSYLLQSADGQVQPAHSVSAGLDYPGVGPEHAFLKDTGRVLYQTATDRQALEAFGELSRLEGILPALESAHAVAWVRTQRARWSEGDMVLINLSGRGDKDVAMVADLGGATP